MRLHKTPKARDVLMSQNLALSQAERRVLILCDGQRTRAMLEKLLGAASTASINALIAQGYLQASPEANAPSTADTATRPPVWPVFQRKQAAPDRDSTHVPAALPAHAESVDRTLGEHMHDQAPARSATRRSLAASKMYMLDMLQLQRNLASSALAVDIQTAANPEQLVTTLLQALRHLCASTKPSMAQRIAQRLDETVPEEYLPMLQEVIATLLDETSTPATTAVADNAVAIRLNVA